MGRSSFPPSVPPLPCVHKPPVWDPGTLLRPVKDARALAASGFATGGQSVVG